MKNKTKMVVATGLAVVLLGAGFGVPIMAADNATDGTPSATESRAGEMDRIAQILGISVDTLENAFDQVQEQVRADAPEGPQARIAGILGISEETLVNAEKQAREEMRDSGLCAPEDQLSRVAEILGITVDALKNAQEQARQEMRDEMQERMQTTADDRLTRVAGILGITGDTLEAAMQQAQKETAEARMNNRLTQAVQDGKITQDEADQIKTWLGQRPAALDKIGGFGEFGGGMGRGGFPGMGGGMDFGGRGFRIMPEGGMTPPAANDTGSQTTN